jgi:uncharacterized protein (DUF362 family)/Pyruvate/2-oxoacid:ferredoxin oxidoreductase delta subunit
VSRSEVLIRPAGYPVGGALVEEILERFAPPLAGRRVLVKPNCLLGAAPEKAATTHPSLVAALVAALRRRGAAVSVGDNPGARGYGSSRRCFAETGLLEAAGEAFVELGAATASTVFPSGIGGSVVVARAVLEADYLITVPKLKTHCLTLLTGAVKNSYGILAGAEKARLHYEARTAARFAEVLVDVYAVRPPDLAVMDAVVAMAGDGPTHGRPYPLGLVLASSDPVALDATAARIVGVQPERVGHLRVAAARGLGRIDAAAIRVDGTPPAAAGFALPSTFRAGVLTWAANAVVFNLLRRSRLRVNVRKCRRCGACAAACPAGAMQLRAGEYRIDEARCQHCYCCSELCPEGAVEVLGALGALVRRHT